MLGDRLIMNGLNWYISQFPEALFPFSVDVVKRMSSHIAYGYDVMQKKSVVICGLARDLGKTAQYSVARLERLGSMFKNYRVIIYENDSSDSTLTELFRWQKRNPNVVILTEKLGNPKREGISNERKKEMAYYRNKYLKEISNYDHDYVIVYDTDLTGGFSYEGICHTFGCQDWDVMASNGLLFRPNKNGDIDRFFYDTWAFRLPGQEEPKITEQNDIYYKRGDPLVRVDSAFGGLAIYKSECIKGTKYTNKDCDHVTLHDQIKKNGFSIYLNPNQITLYTNTGYNIL